MTVETTYSLQSSYNLINLPAQIKSGDTVKANYTYLSDFGTRHSISGQTTLSGNRWRYMLFDTEFSSGLYNFEDTRPGSDTFAKAMKEHPLFAAAMGNPEFREMFKASSLRATTLFFQRRSEYILPVLP